MYFIACSTFAYMTCMIKVTIKYSVFCILYSVFQIHWWIQTGVTVRKCSIRVKIGDFLSRVNLKFDGWPWKIIGHLFYTTLSFVRHFKAIGIFKLELQSGNAQFGSKLTIFFVPGDFENWRMTLKNNRAPLIYYVKLCASFLIHWRVKLELQPGKLKLGKNWFFFCPAWPWKLMYDLEEQ